MTTGIFLSTLFALLSVASWGVRRLLTRLEAGSFEAGSRDYEWQQNFYSLGDAKERQGHIRRLTLYTVCGAVGAVIQVAAELHRTA